MRAFSALLSNTVTPTVLRAGSKTNVIPGSAEAGFDGRTAPGQTKDDLLRELRQAPPLRGTPLKERFRPLGAEQTPPP